MVIAEVVADAEAAFDGGWPVHPQDRGDPREASRRFRSLYLGGAGVVAALHQLSQRGFAEPQREYISYLEDSLDAAPDFPEEDGQRSLWMGEVGIRLVLQRLKPSAPNLEKLARLISANERDERSELMWGSPGTILAGRELELDVSASGRSGCAARRDEEGALDAEPVRRGAKDPLPPRTASPAACSPLEARQASPKRFDATPLSRTA